MVVDRPLVFVDLDDTLFQTARKMAAGEPRLVASLDVQGQPNGFMTPVQEQWARWLLSCADVVPVTARSREASSRVRLPFRHGAICSHGGSLLHSDGSLDRDWHGQMSDALEDVQARLPLLSEALLAIGNELGAALRSWVVAEAGLHHYVVAKHNGSDDAVLAGVLAQARARGLLDGLQVHLNGNNLAFLPKGLGKRLAVGEWLRRDRACHGDRPVMGIGDSISDLGFMDLCHFWATPTHSQLAKAVEDLLDD